MELDGLLGLTWRFLTEQAKGKSGAWSGPQELGQYGWDPHGGNKVALYGQESVCVRD